MPRPYIVRRVKTKPAFAVEFVADAAAAQRMRDGLDMTDSEEIVAAVLKDFRFLERSSCKPETLINRELGVDGDDADGLLREIGRRAQINIDDFDFSRYFGPESASIITILSNALRDKKIHFQPLSIRDLGAYIDGKRRTSGT
jgi:hypothetical protein